ncbi:alpha-amylase [Actinophytocola xinjiangensis]|uniref:Alpha-amylase n=1 Tax=Actinophytocola xinjiangensis TaxID=485602 RepID=A0A7Z1ATZ7_9PSEU|nr:alpha-amylase family glycosyl hydrolase [Actinophytocola xinjiangensis]OLF05356.1 alpha-amylase [Actinophytocola xinjiangensis]
MSVRRAAAALLVPLVVAGLTTTATTATAGDGPRALHSLRGPVTDENFYFVMADRFANGDPGNDRGGLADDPLVSGFDPTKKGFYNGGDLAGLRERLDYIQGLGTTSIWLTPSFTNKPVQPEDGPSAGYHGYWITDFTRIDPHLGSNAELAALVDDAHERGMKVYFDIITNHTADVIGYAQGARRPYTSKDVSPYRTASGEVFDDRDVEGAFPALDPATSFPYTPVLDPDERDLKVPAWLNDVTLYHNRGDTTFTGEDSQYGDFFGLDDLFTENPRVVDGMAEIYERWIADFGIDGFRIDTMKHVDDAFWTEFGPRVLRFAREQGKREFFMFGEVFDTTKDYTSHFTTAGRMQAVLDFPFQDAARTFASRGGPTDALGEFFTGDDWYTDADSNVYSLPTFLGNHDMGRFGGFVVADNPGQGDAEWVSRDRLGHELMYFARGNPVIYYGDEQGFTGPGGDQDARQTLFASRVPEYLDDDLLGTDATHAGDNYDRRHPLYRSISRLAEVTAAHPALRDGVQQHRLSSAESGVYAFSRTDRARGREYVVALNNSEAPKTVAIPTYTAGKSYKLVYGTGSGRLSTSRDGTLTVTVPALSTVVYGLNGRIPRSAGAPRISLAPPVPAAESRGRLEVTADVRGSSLYEVSFEARVGGGRWQPVGTDDNAPYRVFHDVSGAAPGTPVEYRAVVLDNAGHTRAAAPVRATVPAPALTIEAPAEGGGVRGTVEVRAVADPERGTHVVRFERSVAGGAWTAVGSDDTSPAYTVFDDLSALDLAPGTPVAYRALLAGGVSSAVRTVRYAGPPAATATVRYHRPAGDYGEWGLHLWGDALDQSVIDQVTWDDPWPVTRIEDGWAVYEIPLADDTTPVNFIMHLPGGDAVPDTREPGGDRSFLPIDTPQVWLRQGDPAVYPQPPGS